MITPLAGLRLQPKETTSSRIFSADEEKENRSARTHEHEEPRGLFYFLGREITTVTPKRQHHDLLFLC